MNRYIGKLMCWALRKHRRGVRMARGTEPNIPGDQDAIWLRCTRCGTTWTRKARKARAA